MTRQYNDRALTEPQKDALPKPQIEIIIDGNSVFKPGLKTFFVDDYVRESGTFTGKVMGEYCTCDTVLVPYTVCTCESVCSCNLVCTCESVCTCEYVCNCDGHVTCSCVGNTSSGTWVSCGAPCACVPVH